MNDEIIKLALQIAGAKDIDEATAAAKKLESQLGKLAPAAEKAEGSSKNLGQTLLQSGRFVQDFAQGGIGGVLNNVEGLVSALGYGPGLAGALTVVGVVFALALPKLKEFAEYLSGADEKTKGQAEALKNLTETADKLKGKLAELNAINSDRLKHLDSENQLLERKVKLQEQELANTRKAAEEETKRQVAAKAMEAAPSLEEQRRLPSERARAADIKKIVGGDPEAQEIRKALRARIGRRVRTAPENQILNEEAINEMIDKQTDATLGRFYAGDAGALEDVTRSLHPMLGNEGTLREQLGQLTPQAQMAQRGRNIGATLRGFGGRVRRRAADIARERRDRQTDMLNQMGKEGERLSDADRERNVDLDTAEHKRAIDQMNAKGRQIQADKDRQLRDQQRFGREVGRKLIEQQPDLGSMEKLPLLGPGMNAAQLNSAMLSNQQAMTANMAAFQAQLQQARAIGRDQQKITFQRNQPAANNGMPP